MSDRQVRKIARWLEEGWCLMTIKILGVMVTFPYWHKDFGPMPNE